MTADGVPHTSNAEILVVEDDASSLKMLSDLLTKAGYKVRPAGDGELGLRSVQAKKPDLILLDFKLPGMNGVEVCRRLKDNPGTCDIPVIFISALGDSELKVKALDAGAIDYVTKPIDSSEVLARINTHLNLYYLQRSHALQTEELKKHRDHLEELVMERTAELRESEETARALLDATTELAILVNPDGTLVAGNRSMADRFGLTLEELIGKIPFDFWLPEVKKRRWEVFQEVLAGKKPVRFEDENLGTVFNISVYPILDDEGNVRLVAVFAQDITDRKRTEADRKTTIRLLEILNAAVDLREMMQKVLHFMGDLSGCEAVGIRLREGRDFPYYTTRGFDEEFIRAEEYLCTRDLLGQIMYDEMGDPIVECMCGNILCGRFDPSLEFFTAHGSFVSNCTTELLSNTTEEDRQARTRNRCNSEGYESVFLTPLRCGGETFGLLQFNDRRKGWFSPEFVAQAERLADNLAITLAQRRGEEKIAAALKEKEVLLREIHHRVKNNMQVIVSLLRIHARKSESEQMRSIFDDCRARVNAMSLIHEALYQSEDLARIDSESYIGKLCRNMGQIHGASSKGIVLTVGKEDVLLGMDQGVAVGMIVCELVSNIFKHAFPQRETGSVLVSLSCIGEEEVELIVRDDGVGLPPEIDIHNSPSLGLHLASVTTKHELGGSIEVERDGGTRYVIRFKRKAH